MKRVWNHIRWLVLTATGSGVFALGFALFLIHHGEELLDMCRSYGFCFRNPCFLFQKSFEIPKLFLVIVDGSG